MTELEKLKLHLSNLIIKEQQDVVLNANWLLKILEDINLKFKRKRKFESIGEETAVKIQTERNDLIIDKFSGVKFRKNSK